MRWILCAFLLAAVAGGCSTAPSDDCTVDEDWWILAVQMTPPVLTAGTGETVTIDITIEFQDPQRAQWGAPVVPLLLTERGYCARWSSSDGRCITVFTGDWSAPAVEGALATWTLIGPSPVPADLSPGNYLLAVAAGDGFRCTRDYFLPTTVEVP